MEPLKNCPRETLAAVRGVLTDIDDTVSTEGTLSAAAYGALEALKKAGLLVVPVTGRPAGWCDHIARFWPVDAVVGENGAFWMWHDHQQKRLRTRFIQSDAARAEGRRRLERVRADVLAEVPGAGIASDQPYRVADLAVDFREDVPALPPSDIQRIVEIFERHGAHAKVSSIHVNGWFGDYDKLTTSRAMMQELFGVDLTAERARYVFAGDSPNDAPMFGWFPNAVGVANVADFADRLQHRPRWITAGRSGEGFVELAEALLAARR
ncbi:HAD-IIB family hydrolase [Reyranella aquatilis]|uniref:HAD-IIB family hydrolase n=1 Tax=Reyranella aquatilis TaxID=2035356 RepID=A0ABS8L0G6_9HYPH|nr:HAD-IIB family hydrolase [Reyranella aquatilis]MCC8431296.1 HAD-IIB family hydrolase [Reyranella aquatilis]